MWSARAPYHVRLYAYHVPAGLLMHEDLIEATQEIAQLAPELVANLETD